MPGPDTVGGLIMQKAVVSLIDDLDGSEADVTIRFGYEGQDYEIDLNSVHAAEMRDKIGSYAAHARTIRARRPGRTPTRTAASRQYSAQMRAWATEHGFSIKERGRVPVEVVQAYEEARRAGAPEEEPAEAPATTRRRRAPQRRSR
jgi:Lsr2